jgi:uncharacterized membrane protein
MMRQRRGSMMEAGVGLAILGAVVWLVIKFALSFSWLIMNLAGWAVIIGIIIAIVGAINDRR